jgi:pimeloyl-ACP methyl ester carboxylesterase
MELSLWISEREVILHYEWYGDGPETLITFHGFGQQGKDMHPLNKAFINTHRIYHIDIFYHGKSYWNEEIGPLTKSIWVKIIFHFLARENIKVFDIAAFSMGGKFLLATVEAFSTHINHIYLIAPDGIKTSTWYSLASYPYFFRHYFQSMIVKPWRFYSLIKGLQRLHLLDKGLAKFASTQMDTRRKRRQVYYSWVMFRHLTYNHKIIASIINDHSIKVDIYVGRYDKIITEKGLKKLTRHLIDYRLHIIESGHNQLIVSTARKLVKKI